MKSIFMLNGKEISHPEDSEIEISIDWSNNQLDKSVEETWKLEDDKFVKVPDKNNGIPCNVYSHIPRKIKKRMDHFGIMKVHTEFGILYLKKIKLS